MRKDGTLFWANVVITALRDARGTLVGFAKVTRDLTERRAFELALRDREERVRQLLDAAPDPMMVVNEGGMIETVNVQAQRLLGYTRGELIGQSIDVLGPDARRGRIAAQRVPAPAAPSAGAEQEMQARHKDGREIPVSITLSTMHTQDGLFVTVALRDVTDRRREQAQLLAAEERFRRSFDDALVGMMILDLAGRYVRVNDAFCRIVGYPREQLIGCSHELITPRATPARDKRALSSLIAGDMDHYTAETQYRHADGELFWAAIGITLIRDVDGHPAHFIGQAQDITERRRAEDELAAAHEAALEASRAEVGVPRQHEPRDPHAAQRRDRDEPACCSTPSSTASSASTPRRSARRARRCWR